MHIKATILSREPRREKTGLRGFRPGPTQTGLCRCRRWLEALNFGFRKNRICTIRVAKTVTANLICVFVFACANCWFFHDAAQIFFCPSYMRANLCLFSQIIYTSYISNLPAYVPWLLPLTEVCPSVWNIEQLGKGFELGFVGEELTFFVNRL